RQFALTIAVSTLISAFNSLTLSPALTALLLRPRGEGHVTAPLPRLAFPVLGAWIGYAYLTQFFVGRMPEGWPAWSAAASAGAAGVGLGWVLGPPLHAILAWVFRSFNAAFNFSTGIYTRATGLLLRGSVIVLLLYVGLLGLTYAGFNAAPKGFIPPQDKGYLLVNVQLPDSASLPRTRQIVQTLEHVALQTPGVKHTVAVAGQSLLLNANAPNYGSMYVMLDDFHKR